MDRLLALSDDLAAAVARAAEAVFAIQGRPRVPSTGIHWRPGLVVTAAHTVPSDDEITVVRPNGETVPATVLGRESALDVAVLKVDAPDVRPAELGDSDSVRVGHMVLAVGAGPRASWGVISAIGGGSATRSPSDTFSLDLTLYPGFSGGPLVDARGAVIGLNTSGASRHLQLAIAAKAVDRVVDAVARHGRVPHAYLGVRTQRVRVPEGVTEGDPQGRRTAVIVVEVEPGSPAGAVLLVGDVILSLDGAAVSDPLDLRAMLRPERIGQRVTASVVRAGRVLDVGLTIGERPERAR
jgi:S1-C subfamily serine protease